MRPLSELQGSWGIEVLLADLERGRWPRTAVGLVETGSPEQSVTRLGAAESNRLLRQGPLAVSLVVAEPGRGGVFVPGELPGLSALEAVLLEAARDLPHAVSAMQPGPGGGVWRVALSDGSLGSGRVDEAGSDGATGDERIGGLGGPEAGVWLLVPAPQALLDSPALTWVSAQQRAERRAEAAREGCFVEAAAWDRLYAASRHYLVD